MSEQFKDLMELFIRADALLHRYQGTYFRNFGPFASPHKGQGRVLSLLKLQPEITQKELGYLLDMRNQSLGELLGKLERNGYITRTPSEKDRRVMNIKLTEEGAKAAAQLDGKQEDVNQIFSCLSEEEQAVLSDYLERLIDALEKTFEEMGIPEHDHGRPCGHPYSHPHGHSHEQERDFGSPQGFGGPFASRHDPRASFPGRPGFPGTPKRPERPEGYGHEQVPCNGEHPGRQGRDDFYGHGEHPGRHGRNEFCGYAKRPDRQGRDDFSGYPEHPGRHERDDFSGYGEHPGRHGHEDDLDFRYFEQFQSSERPEAPYRPEFSESFDCPKHPGCHGNRCPECDFEELKCKYTRNWEKMSEVGDVDTEAGKTDTDTNACDTITKTDKADIEVETNTMTKDSDMKDSNKE